MVKLSHGIFLALAISTTNAFSVVNRRGLAGKGTVSSTKQQQQHFKLQMAMEQNNNNNIKSDDSQNPFLAFLKPFGAAAIASTMLLSNILTIAPPAPAIAYDSQIVGELRGSGLVFKDTLVIERFEDPKVKGVTLYISNFERPLTEKIASGGNFFNDPSYASVGCAKTGPIQIADNVAKGKGGEEVFEESRSLLFKSLRVQRIYDEQQKTMVYVSFNTRLDKGEDSNKSRFKSSLCVVGLDDQPAAPAVAPAAAAPAK